MQLLKRSFLLCCLEIHNWPKFKLQIMLFCRQQSENKAHYGTLSDSHRWVLLLSTEILAGWIGRINYSSLVWKVGQAEFGPFTNKSSYMEPQKDWGATGWRPPCVTPCVRWQLITHLCIGFEMETVTLLSSLSLCGWGQCLFSGPCRMVWAAPEEGTEEEDEEEEEEEEDADELRSGR